MFARILTEYLKMVSLAAHAQLVRVSASKDGASLKTVQLIQIVAYLMFSGAEDPMDTPAMTSSASQETKSNSDEPSLLFSN